ERFSLLQQINKTFEDVLAARETGRLFKYSGNLIETIGVKRVQIEDPIRNSTWFEEQYVEVPGVYFAVDENTGHETIVIARPDRSNVEFRRDKAVQAIVTGRTEGDYWVVMPGSKTNQVLLASLRERQPDFGALGYSVYASGDVYKEITQPVNLGKRIIE